MVRLILSFGILAARALAITSLRLELLEGSGPPAFTATIISRAIFVNIFARCASLAPFFRLMVLHLECPDILFAPYNFMISVYYYII